MIGTRWLLSNGPLRKGGPLRVGLEAGTSKKKKEKEPAVLIYARTFQVLLKDYVYVVPKKEGRDVVFRKEMAWQV